jgi:hypothetical protein
MEKYSRIVQAAEDNITRLMLYVYWVIKATGSDLLLYHDNNGYANARQCYVIRTLPVLLYSALLQTRISHVSRA